MTAATTFRTTLPLSEPYLDNRIAPTLDLILGRQNVPGCNGNHPGFWIKGICGNRVTVELNYGEFVVQSDDPNALGEVSNLIQALIRFYSWSA